MAHYFVELSYLFASIFFIIGLKSLSHPDTARRGMHLAEVGMLLAIVGTLLHHEIVTYEWIIVGLVIGGIIGGTIAHFVPMTALPQQTALSHAFGALAATLVGVAEFHRHGADLGAAKTVAIGIEVLLGALTTTGSFVAAAKLHDLLPGAPLTFRGQNIFNLSLLALAVGSFIYLLLVPGTAFAFYLMLTIALIFGLMLVLPIAAADMPVVVSMLNSYSGWAAAGIGFTLGNVALIITGALVGSSGAILSYIMCKAMNRSFISVIAGGFGGEVAAVGGEAGEQKPVKLGSAEDAGYLLKNAQKVIIVPGYGMAVAQAQHALREMGEVLKKAGVEVKYAIHPVAGRMPGHMNVLLAEANVPYDEVFELEDINSEFQQADIAFVIGANDVTNPAAEEDKTSPIYGMPVLQVWKAGTVMFNKRSLASGYAGVDNPLFYKDNTMMLLGDAKKMTESIVKALAH